MFSAMEFARVGIVPVHVLRGLEVAGMLMPRHTGPGGGRRLYDAGQLPRLNRILVLTDLGFTLPQVRAILATRLSEHELRGLLRLRRAELAARVNADAARLERVEARLTVLAGVGDPPEPPECASRPRGGTSPTHRPLAGPEARTRWAGTNASPQRARGARRWDRPFTRPEGPVRWAGNDRLTATPAANPDTPAAHRPEAWFGGPARTRRRDLSALLADRTSA